MLTDDDGDDDDGDGGDGDDEEDEDTGRRVTSRNCTVRPKLT